MSKSQVVKFKVAEIKGAMDYGVGHILLHPPNIFVSIEVMGEVDNNGNIEVTPDELNRLVAQARAIAYADTPR